MNETEQLQREIETLRAKNQTLEANSQTLRAKNQTLRASNQTLRASNQTLEANNRSLEANNRSLGDQIDRLAATNDSLVGNAKALSESKDELEQKCQDLRSALAKKQDELDALIRRLFGRQSERFDDDDQLKFAFASQAEIDDAREGIQQAIEENKQASKKKPPKRRRREERFPDSLPRKEIVIDLEEDQKEGLIRIGEDVVESAHYTRAEVYVLRKVFPKYVRQEEPKAGVFQATRPPALISGDRYDTSFAAAVIANRLGYHLPIYRQEDMFAECGLSLSREARS